MNRIPKLNIILFTIIIALGVQKVSANESISGFYSIPFESSYRDSGASCNEEGAIGRFEDSDGNLYCEQPIKTFDTLELKQNENNLSFGIHLNFYNGHSCNLRGVALKAEQGWKYTGTEEEECTMFFKVDNEHILVDVDPDRSCKGHCGARGHFSGNKFPLSSWQEEPPFEYSE